MLQSILSSVGHSALQRAVLGVNHLLMAEPVARERLRAHVGKQLRIELTDWPAAMPPPPPAHLSVTPAGLFEAAEVEPVTGTSAARSADLVLRIAASDPAGWVVALARGNPPAVDVQGDAQLASELQWLAVNLRWDLEGDLARFTGGPAAHLSVTPAGLFEAAEVEPVTGTIAARSADLVLRIAASDPAGWVAALARGNPPAVDVQGDAQLASELQWLAVNLRWDLEGDLARFTGGPAAHQIAAAGRTLRDGLRRWLPPAPDATRRS